MVKRFISLPRSEALQGHPLIVTFDKKTGSEVFILCSPFLFGRNGSLKITLQAIYQQKY